MSFVIRVSSTAAMVDSDGEEEKTKRERRGVGFLFRVSSGTEARSGRLPSHRL